MTFLIMILLLLLLGVILKWHPGKRFIGLIVGLYAVVLLASPVVYQLLTKETPMSYTMAQVKNYQQEQQQFLTDLASGKRDAYADFLLYTKTLAYKKDLFYMNSEIEEHQVLYVVEEAPDLEGEVEVSMYKRPSLVDDVDVSALYPEPTIQFKKDKLIVRGQQETLELTAKGVTLLPVAWDESDDEFNNNPYVAYIRVPMHTRVLDRYDKRIFEGGETHDN